MRTLMMVMMVSVAAFGQGAHVVELSAPDATSAKIAYESLQRAQKSWEAEQKRIARKYLVVAPGDPDASDDHFTDENLNTGIVTGGTFFGVAGGGGCLNAVTGYGTPCSDQHKPTKEETAQQEIHDKQQAAIERARAEAYAREARKRRGFESCCENTLPGFEFSHDFKFIVPAAPPEPAKNPYSGFVVSN